MSDALSAMQMAKVTFYYVESIQLAWLQQAAEVCLGKSEVF